jgi:hypothetical protein
MSSNNVKHADPMKTKTGKTRLGPLNLKQLTEMLAKESKAKNKGKIQPIITLPNVVLKSTLFIRESTKF